jgi:hypothetical protein
MTLVASHLCTKPWPINLANAWLAGWITVIVFIYGYIQLTHP